MTLKLIVENQQTSQRLDVFCVQSLPGYSRSRIQQAIKTGLIKVNNQIVKPRYYIRAGDVISAQTTNLTKLPPPPANSLTIPVIYEDKDLVVINKPPGLTVHPGIANETTTVVSWFIEHYPDSHDVGEDPVRPGIVHRLDKDTSGSMVLAKNNPAFQYLKQQFKKQHPMKEYLALVFGHPNSTKGRVTQPISRSPGNPLRRMIHADGKPAITEWQIAKPLGPKYTLLRVFPFTGRTHQIRLHLHFISHPIVGDRLYTFKRQKPPSGVTRQLLHAEKITLRILSGKRKTFTAPLPADFASVINALAEQ